MRPGVLLALVWVALGHAAASDPQAVLRAVVDSQRGGSLRATLTMEVVRPERTTRFVIEIASDGAERAIIWVRAPAREAGQAFLRIGESIQLYSPVLRRVLRLPPGGRADSFLGSDLSYGDLAGRDLERDFTPRITAETPTQITLELTPAPLAPTPYGRVVVLASRPALALLQMTYYDQRGRAVRRLNFSRHTEVQGRQVPLQVEVEDLLRPGQRTSLVFSNHRFGVTIPEACFTIRALEVGC